MTKRRVRGRNPFGRHRPGHHEEEQMDKLRSACERVYEVLLELAPNVWNERAIERLVEVCMLGNKGVVMAAEGPVAPPEPLPELGIEAPPELKAQLEQERMKVIGWGS